MSKDIVTVLHVTYLFKFVYVYFGQLSTQANEMAQRVKCERSPCKDLHLVPRTCVSPDIAARDYNPSASVVV